MTARGPDNFWPVEKWHGPKIVHRTSRTKTGLEHGCEMNLTTSRSLGSDAGSTLVTARTRGSREAGFTLIDMLFVVALIGLLASMAIPGLMRAKGAAQAASALGSLRRRQQRAAQLRDHVRPRLLLAGPPDAWRAAARRRPKRYLPADMAAGFTFIKSGYNFSLAGTPLAGAPATCNGLATGQAAPGYAVVGDPLDPMASVSAILRHELGRRDLRAHAPRSRRRCRRRAARRRARRSSRRTPRVDSTFVQHGAAEPEPAPLSVLERTLLRASPRSFLVSLAVPGGLRCSRAPPTRSFVPLALLLACAAPSVGADDHDARSSSSGSISATTTSWRPTRSSPSTGTSSTRNPTG